MVPPPFLPDSAKDIFLTGFISIIVWRFNENCRGHVGSVVAAVIAGAVAYIFYPTIKYCFLVIGASALLAMAFVGYLPQGDPLMGRGFKGETAIDEDGHIEQLSTESASQYETSTTVPIDNCGKRKEPIATSYWTVFSDMKTCILCLTGFFFQ